MSLPSFRCFRSLAFPSLVASSSLLPPSLSLSLPPTLSSGLSHPSRRAPKMLLILAPLLFSLFSLVQSSQFPFPHHPASPTPTPPKLQWLFTVHLMTLQNPAPLLPGPQGIRIDLAIIGGTFQGLGGLNGSFYPSPFFNLLF